MKGSKRGKARVISNQKGEDDATKLMKEVLKMSESECVSVLGRLRKQKGDKK